MVLHVHLPEDGKTRALRHIYEEGSRLERLSSKLMLLIGLYENDSIQMKETELSELFENDDLAVSFSKKGMQKAQKAHDREQNLQAYMDMYQDIFNS